MGVRIATNITLPKDLVRELDAFAGHRNRSAFIEDAIRDRLRRERVRRAFESVRGAWAGKGPAVWDEPDGVARWVRKLRAEVTDPGPDESS